MTILYIADSKIHGLGVFSKVNIKAGTRIIEELSSREIKFRGFNHSCNFNAILVSPVDPKRLQERRLDVLILRNLNALTEITVDYTWGYNDKALYAPCLCQAKFCRKPI